MISKHGQLKFIQLMTPTVGDNRFYQRWEEVAAPTYKEAEADIAVINFNVVVDDAFFTRFPKVKYVVSPTTGHTHLTADFKARGVTLITLRGETEFLSQIGSVAEYVLYIMIHLPNYSYFFSPYLFP